MCIASSIVLWFAFFCLFQILLLDPFETHVFHSCGARVIQYHSWCLFFTLLVLYFLSALCLMFLHSGVHLSFSFTKICFGILTRNFIYTISLISWISGKFAWQNTNITCLQHGVMYTWNFKYEHFMHGEVRGRFGQFWGPETLGVDDPPSQIIKNKSSI